MIMIMTIIIIIIINLLLLLLLLLLFGPYHFAPFLTTKFFYLTLIFNLRVYITLFSHRQSSLRNS